MTDLGYLMDEGRGIPKNVEGARQLYEQAVALDPKQSAALNNLGAYHHDQFAAARKRGDTAVAQRERERAVSYYTRATEIGHDRAARNLAGLYADPDLGEPDYGKAYEYFTRAAEKGDTYARFRLGEMHEKGQGVPVTPQEAAYHYRLAGLDGHLESLRRLAAFYLEGKSGSQDLERATFWLIRLAGEGQVSGLMAYVDVALAQGKYPEAVKALDGLRKHSDPKVSSFAYERLARCYTAGLGVKAKPSRAAAYRDKAAKLGNGDAIFALGNEKFAEKKDVEGRALYAEAAEKGSAAACVAMARIHYAGEGVPASPAESIRYLRKAIALNNRDAMYTLAVLTYSKTPGAPELDEAIELARRADLMGEPKAATLRERLEKRRDKAATSKETTGARPS